MKSFKEKIIIYANKLLEKEREKYAVGSKNDYFNVADECDDLIDFLNHHKSEQEEIARLKAENKALLNKLYGRG